MNLKKFFNPTSIAIVGVSNNPLKVGHLVAKNMLEAGYDGKLYFVHPTEKELLGKKAFPSLSSIGKSVDLVIFSLPGKLAVPMLDEVAYIGCKHVVIFAAGFKENHTEEGDLLEKRLHDKLQKHNITLLGPNCIGFINTKKKINATFLKRGAPKGKIGVISQSGALGSALVDTIAAHVNLGLSYFISLGNKSALDESDCLSFLSEDPDTSVIGMYLEDVTNGAKFRKTLIQVSKKKPVVILKGGATKAGSQAAMSHTGSLVGDDQVFEAVCNQAGAIRVHSYEHFYELLKLFSYNKLPTSKNILVLSNAGGMGVLLADELVQHDMSLVVISEKTKEKLYKEFDASKKITVHNPIDLLGDASAFDYQKAIQLSLQEKNIGAVMILLTPQANTEIMPTAEVLTNAQNKLVKMKDPQPLYPVFMGEASVTEARQFFEKHNMASFIEFDGVPSLLSKILLRNEYVKMPVSTLSSTLYISLKAHSHKILTLLLEHISQPFLNQYDSLKILEYTGMNVAHTYLATTEKDLDHILKKEGFPLVAKIASEKITHKTEVKGVITGLDTWEELSQAYSQLSTISGTDEGCYIQKQYSGYELILGSKRDNTFGTVILLGLGGIYAELMKEVVQFVYPFSYPYFESVLKKSKLKKLIDGYRNMPILDLKKLYESSMRLGELMELHDQIKEIDINPYIVSDKDMIAADGRIILNQES